jgi:hypothetical protein
MHNAFQSLSSMTMAWNWWLANASRISDLPSRKLITDVQTSSLYLCNCSRSHHFEQRTSCSHTSISLQQQARRSSTNKNFLDRNMKFGCHSDDYWQQRFDVSWCHKKNKQTRDLLCHIQNTWQQNTLSNLISPISRWLDQHLISLNFPQFGHSKLDCCRFYLLAFDSWKMKMSAIEHSKDGTRLSNFVISSFARLCRYNVDPGSWKNATKSKTVANDLRNICGFKIIKLLKVPANHGIA